jgi:dTDP-4-amino-4,6-dideoxygalactose transaminase
MASIPLVDLKAQYAAIKGEIDAAIQRVVDACDFVMGKEMVAFEQDFAAYCGVRHAIGVSTGSDALTLALLACGIGPGDEVITVPNTFIATTEAITHVGATIRFVDIDDATYTMDPDCLEEAITPRTRAILPVHLYGQMAPMDAIVDIARRHSLWVIEDAAQAHGARWKGQRAGSVGDVACFSFYPSKNLGAYGDGGMVVTNNDAIAERLRLLRDHGQNRERKYEHLTEGFCARLDTIQAAILRVKLRYLDSWNAQRRAHARLYGELLDGSSITPPYVRPEAEHVYHIYAVWVPQRDRIMAEMVRHGIGVRVHYPIPLHLQPAYKRLGLGPGSFPAAERATAHILSLPMYAELTKEQIEHVAYTLRHVADG